MCLNWPPYAQSKTTPDLKIDRKTNPTLDPASDGQSATTLKSGESATVTITSYDWGAYGHLTATAILDNNEGEITAHVQGGEKYDLTIPKDDNGNHIADFWEKTHAGGNAEADDDEQPHGNGDHGDGLSLYEEYRGFHVQGRHIWTNPKLKDIFIYDSTGLGVGYLARSGLAIHLVNADEFAQEAGSPNPRVINPNRGYATRGPQHVLGLTLGTLDGDYGFDDPSPGPPKRLCQRDHR